MFKFLLIKIGTIVFLLFVCTISVCFSSINFSAKEREYLLNKKQITMCIDPDWMPYEKIENGHHIGMSSEYFHIFEERIGVPIKLVPTQSWSESISYAKSRKCDIFSLAMRTPEREKYMNFTKPYLKVPLVITTQSDKPFVISFLDIIDKRLGIVEGYAFVEILRNKYPAINIVEVKDIKEGLKKVKQGEIFGYIGTLPGLGYIIQRNYSSDLKINGKFDESWELSVATRNDEPLLDDVFIRAIDSISEKQHVQIMNSWLSIKYDQGIDWVFIKKVFFVVVLALSLASVYLWQIRRKNRQLSLKNTALEKALSEVSTLSGLLPICSHCKKIRDDKGYWTQIESYIHEHSEAEFSHAICQDCADKYYPDMDLYDDE